MCFLHPNQTGIHPAGEKQSFVFGIANTPPEICEKQNGSRARPPKAGRAHDKKPERIRLIVIQFFVFTNNRIKKFPCFCFCLKRTVKLRKTSGPTNPPHNNAPFLLYLP